MKLFPVFLISLSIVCTSMSAHSMVASVECYEYSLEEYNVANRAYMMPLSNIVRVEKNAVDGKDRMTIFTEKQNASISKNVFLGTANINEDGFSFKGTDTVSYDQIDTKIVGSKVLSIQIANYKTDRYTSILSANTVAGQNCRKGLYPESLER